MGKVVLHTTPDLNVADLYELIHLDSAWKGHWPFFSHSDQLAVVKELFHSAPFTVENIEHSFVQDGLSIPAFRFGNPKGKPVILWARQHGDEPECSAALNTVLWILFNEIGNIVIAEILHNINFIVVPMVNPAGTNRFTRQSLVGVDMNRDAHATVTSGAQLLTHLRQKYQPKFAFNLHDMNPRKDRPSGAPELVTLAFQAAPYNPENSDNLIRLRSKTIIGYIVEQIKPYAPRLARYASNYMPRGFGDKSMSNGVSCILVESGSLPEEMGGDAEVAKLHALSVLLGLHAIAHEFDEKLEGNTYESLPYDQGVFDFDTALRHGEILDFATNQRMKADVGIQRHLLEDHVSRDRQIRSEITHLGDLWPEYAIVNLEAHDSLILPGLFGIFPENPFTNGQPTEVQAQQLLQLGFTSIAVPITLPKGVDEVQFAARARTAPPFLNMLTFLSVASLQEIINRHGSTEFLGFAVHGFWSAEALSFISSQSGIKVPEIQNNQSWKGTLFFTSGVCPQQRHARLQLQEPSTQKGISESELKAFMESFQLGKSQCSIGFSITHSGTDLGLNPELNKQQFSALLIPEKLLSLQQKSAQFAGQLNLKTLGNVRFKSQGDLAVYATIKDVLEPLPATVLLNGEWAVHEKSLSPFTRYGRWFFADHE